MDKLSAFSKRQFRIQNSIRKLDIMKCVEKEKQLDATGLLHLKYAQHVSGTFMPIIRSSRLYMCYYRLWCAKPWLLVVGGQVQDSRLCVWSEGCYSIPVEQHPSSRTHSLLSAPDLQQATKASHTIGGNNTHIVSSS